MSGCADESWVEWLLVEGPFLLLVGAAIAAFPVVLGQGGTAHQACVAAFATLLAPGAAIEPVLAIARLVIRIEGHGR